MNKKVYIWMQLLGFDKNDPDRGVARYLEQTGFTPDAVCALLFHADFIHLHRGMDQEWELFQDNCAYHGIPRNKERARQNWTNYDLRTLIAELKKRGVEFYAGLMGSYCNDTFHREWLSDHPELRASRRDKDGSLMCLKRFRDGTYYEDFFIRKAVEAAEDYGFAGIHLADSFCPTSRLYQSDYSPDMIGQFTDHTGIALPAALCTEENGLEIRAARADYIWRYLREEWIRFYEWRWERFFQKLCAAMHAAGKKVSILGMYCTDPFETRYIYGFDTARVMAAGVDMISANILPTSVSLGAPNSPYFFHRYHMITPLLRAQIKEAGLLTMVGVQDASEEWSVLNHQPVKIERDIFTEMSFVYPAETGYETASEGVFLCLGDGIDHRDWETLKSHVDIGFLQDVAEPVSPMILWSDTEQEAMLHEYIQNRRVSAHKQCTEIFREGTPFAGAIRSDRMNGFTGVLFVPNYDLLSDEERATLASYPGAWVGTAPADYAAIPAGAFTCADRFSNYPLRAFLCNAELTVEERAEIETLCAEDDGVAIPAEYSDAHVNSLETETPFTKLTRGFVQACGVLLRAAVYGRFPVRSSQPVAIFRQKSGAYRLYLYNRDDDHYGHALVQTAFLLKDVKTVSLFPVLPPRFIANTDTAFTFDYNNNTPEGKRGFQVKLAPAGVTIMDIWPQEN